MDINDKSNDELNYRIYQNVTGWEYLTTASKQQLNNVISSLNDEIYLLIIKHDIRQDMDEPYYSGYAGDYEQKIKRKEKKYGKNIKI